MSPEANTGEDAPTGKPADAEGASGEAAAPVHRRRPRYPGKYPRRFEHKYKEHRPDLYPEAAAHIEGTGKTLAGGHRPILVGEILRVLAPKAGEVAVDCTLGHGGHALALLGEVRRDGAAGRLIGLDVDPIEMPRAEARLRSAGFGPEAFEAVASNFAGLPQVLARLGVEGADVILADLGVSSMQIDDPKRGFTFKHDGPLDLRLNPTRGVAAADWLAGVKTGRLEAALREGADEPRAVQLAADLVKAREKRGFRRTRELADWLKAWATGVGMGRDDSEAMIRRVFQALRIAVNDEYSALDSWLRNLPACLKPGGRVAVLTFHSGEDRRVKLAFEAGVAAGTYAEAPETVIRPGPEERRANPRSSSAKLRWARRAG